jgi:chemotaxis regulatin CheY-phosphate phosphatase CheZ
MSNGDSAGSGIPILGPILDALGSLFGGQSQVQGLAQAVGQVEKAAWENTLNLAGFAYGAFGDVLHTLGDAIKKIGSALEHLLKDIIFGHLLALIKAIRDFLKHLHDLIAPLIKELQTLQRQYNQIVGKQMRRYLDLIQRIRKILVPFRLLHLGFAKKLDAKLVALESDIGKQWAKLIAHQNEILGVLDTIVDPRNLLRPGSTLGSLGAMIAAVHGAIGAADMRTLFCMGPATVASPLVAPWATTSALTLAEIRSKSGDYAVAMAQRDATLRQYALDLGTRSIA